MLEDMASFVDTSARPYPPAPPLALEFPLLLLSTSCSLAGCGGAQSARWTLQSVATPEGIFDQQL
jgi:hypothetical protein